MTTTTIVRDGYAIHGWVDRPTCRSAQLIPMQLLGQEPPAEHAQPVQSHPLLASSAVHESKAKLSHDDPKQPSALSHCVYGHAQPATWQPYVAFKRPHGLLSTPTTSTR